MRGSCRTVLLGGSDSCIAFSLDTGRASQASGRHSRQHRLHESRYRKAPNEPHREHPWERNALYRSSTPKCEC